MKCYQKDYPRPQFVREANSWESLSGLWDFTFDDKNEGLDGAWYRTFPKGREITVPFTYECPKSGVGDLSRHDVVWYHRNLNLTEEKLMDKKVILHFEGSDYRTGLWVNGNFAGEHKGGYARFSFDITHLTAGGKNDITVRVEDSFDTAQPRGKQRWKDKNFGCWYVQTTGIWKTLWLEYVNAEHIKSVKMTPALSEGRLWIEAEVDARFGNDVALEAAISFKDKAVNCVTIPVTEKRLEFCVDVASVNVSEWGVHAWSPKNPNLYDITFTLKRNGKTLDEAGSYFGMRDIRIDGANVLLNGRPLYQRLILDQGYWKDSHLTPPNEEALITDIDKLLSAGYNGVRKHQKTEDERFLYWADVKGFLVWSEVPATYIFNDDAVTNFTREWMEIVRQNYNHPAIITWTPFNESWGVANIRTNRAEQAFTEAIYYLTKSYDKMRPVICNDGWEHTVSDIITLHDYEENGEDFFERYGEHLQEILENRLYHNLGKPAFADGYSYDGQPVIISEFGGIAFNNSGDGWGYGNKVNSKEAYIKRFDAITTAIKKIPNIAGFCYTQVTDVQQEINGIMDMDRNFKVEPAVLKEINERKVSNFYRIR
jgi:beta-galactosidase/beta-glucuronidase